MAKTQIADVIEPSIFAQYVVLATAEKSALFQSGIVGADPRISERINPKGGRTINMPFWNDLAGESEVLSDSGSLTPAKIDAADDVAALNFRGRAWSANDLAHEVAGSDPMQAIAGRVATFWARDHQKTLVAQADGLFDNATGVLYATHANDIASESVAGQGAGTIFNDADFLNTVFLLGDEQEAFQALVVHSSVMKDMMTQDLISYVQPSGEPGIIPRYRGRQVIVDDGVPQRAGTTDGVVYTSLIFGQGALGWGERMARVPVETDRVALAGDDVLINRRTDVMHPRGVKWIGSPGGATPSNTEFATPGNWSKAYPDKLIRIAALITN